MMKKKMILNITSRKKRDTMLASNATITGPIAVPAGETVIMWCPTYRVIRNSATAGNPQASEYDRESQTVFMRGLKENIHIETSTPDAWEWRRICFTRKGDWNAEVIPQADYTNTSLGLASSVNYNRNLKPLTTAEYGAVFEEILRGRLGTDYNDPIRAPADKRNYRIMYDKLVKINSGNQQGVIRDYRRWHPMNKNLVYGDEEYGTNPVTEGFSTEGKPGMGDYYVVDIFRSITGATGVLSYLPTASLYWHEK